MAFRMWALIVAWVLFIWFIGWRVVKHGITVSFVIGAFVVFSLLSWQSWLEYTWQHNEVLYAQAIEPITGPGKVVHCQRLIATWAFAGAESAHVAYNANGTPGNEAWLTYNTCRDLGRWMSSDKIEPTLAEVTAVHILTHEAEHLAGIRSEANAECAAMNSDQMVAERLGATPGQARQLQLTYAFRVYPHLSNDYKNPNCPVPTP